MMEVVNEHSDVWMNLPHQSRRLEGACGGDLVQRRPHHQFPKTLKSGGYAPLGSGLCVAVMVLSGARPVVRYVLPDELPMHPCPAGYILNLSCPAAPFENPKKDIPCLSRLLCLFCSS